MTPQEYTLSDESGEVTFWGYRLGTVCVRACRGEETITAYFALAEVGEPDRLITTDGQGIRQDREEYSFLSYYGIRLAHPLVWAPPDWDGE